MIAVADSRNTSTQSFVWPPPLGPQSVGRLMGEAPSLTTTSRFTFSRSPNGANGDWLVPLLDKLRTLTRLVRGWDGYQAEKPSQLALHEAQEFLIALRAADQKPTRVAASVVGGVGITFRANGRKSYVEFYNDGSAYVLFSDGVGEPDTQPVRTEDYGSLIEKVRRYLDA